MLVASSAIGCCKFHSRLGYIVQLILSDLIDDLKALHVIDVCNREGWRKVGWDILIYNYAGLK